MAGRVLRDSKGRYAGSTRGWGAGRGRGGSSQSGGKTIKKKGSGVQMARPAAVRVAIQRGLSVGAKSATTGMIARQPVLVAAGGLDAVRVGASTYRRARTGRL